MCFHISLSITEGDMAVQGFSIEMLQIRHILQDVTAMCAYLLRYKFIRCHKYVRNVLRHILDPIFGCHTYVRSKLPSKMLCHTYVRSKLPSKMLCHTYVHSKLPLRCCVIII